VLGKGFFCVIDLFILPFFSGGGGGSLLGERVFFSDRGYKVRGNFSKILGKKRRSVGGGLSSAREKGKNLQEDKGTTLEKVSPKKSADRSPEGETRFTACWVEGNTIRRGVRA